MFLKKLFVYKRHAFDLVRQVEISAMLLLYLERFTSAIKSCFVRYFSANLKHYTHLCEHFLERIIRTN